MSPLFTLAAGLACLLLGLGYLLRPDLIERMNALLREYLLNDSYIALERKKWGTFLVLAAVLLLHAAWVALGR